MKKILIWSLAAVFGLIVLGVIACTLFLDSAVKKGVETVGPKLTDVSIKLDGVSLSLFSGVGKISGLVVGNPAGYKTPAAMQVVTASLAISPGSVLSDKVVIKSINLQAPEITFETDLKGNNLSKILSNVQAATGSGAATQPAETQGSKKLQVDDFLISGAKLNVSVTALGGKSVTVPLPDIHLTALGTGPEGITAGELVKLALQAIEKQAVEAAGPAVANLSKQAADLTKDLGKSAAESADKALKGLGGFLKK